MDDGVPTADGGDENAAPSTEISRPIDAPRRCFICLTDEDATDPPDSWVDPCPCTLEAHQDCMLSWVTDCERSGKPLLCPVCKSVIELESPWDPIVAVSSAIQRRFSRASPYLLISGVSTGVQFSLQMYGALAMWTFAGRDSTMRFLLGTDATMDVHAVQGGSLKERVLKALTMMNVAPVLVFARLFPCLSHRVFCPTASIYGMYQLIHDDSFLSWPPSPKLVMTAFPYVQASYHYLWARIVLPYEVRLNRQLMGLPVVELTGQQAPEGRARVERNGGGGVLGFLQGVVDVLEPEDGRHEMNHLDELLHELHEEGEDDDDDQQGELRGEIMVQVQIGHAGGGQAPIQAAQLVAEGEPPAAANEDENGDDEENDDAEEEQEGHEAPQPPPFRGMGLAMALSSLTNSVVDALLLPVISMALGEALRMMLPRSWTAVQSRSPWRRFGIVGRPGLLQQQWGRSLMGGCLFIVFKDVLRLYSKSRRVAAMGSRRVRNVERQRRSNGTAR
ncbi:RING finger domain protein [Ophiocordyceps camponoti-floridani]|uniref:RING finger domain protein n=1 Tax=Ophiocordyceps camponoti-floridani TaxID=2030778 RepID=A0A8H4Q488_9HYPO|nr:RING finger domain protein [Ophiocordyceps camponoti-floridani]